MWACHLCKFRSNFFMESCNGYRMCPACGYGTKIITIKDLVCHEDPHSTVFFDDDPPDFLLAEKDRPVSPAVPHKFAVPECPPLKKKKTAPPLRAMQAIGKRKVTVRKESAFVTLLIHPSVSELGELSLPGKKRTQCWAKLAK